MTPPKNQKSKNPLLDTLISMIGQDNVITVHRNIVLFMDGSLEGAMLLEQLLYWTPRSIMGGWVVKSDIELQRELCLKRYSVRAACRLLTKRGLLESKVKRFRNFPTKHYKINLENLAIQWDSFISRLSENEQTEYLKTNKHCSSENERTLTEITRDFSPLLLSEETIEKILSKMPFDKKHIKELDEILSKGAKQEWIWDAISIAHDKNKLRASYVLGILKNFLVERTTANDSADSNKGNYKRTKQPRPNKAHSAESSNQSTIEAARRVLAKRGKANL